MCCAVSLWIRSLRMCTPMGNLGEECHPLSHRVSTSRGCGMPRAGQGQIQISGSRIAWRLYVVETWGSITCIAIQPFASLWK